MNVISVVARNGYLLTTRVSVFGLKYMKKYIVGLLLAFPMLVSAQTVQENYQNALLQLIGLLEQQVTSLENQLAELAVPVPVVSNFPQQVQTINQIYGNIDVATSTQIIPQIMEPSATILVNGQSEVTASTGFIPTISWTTQGVLDNSCAIGTGGQSWGGNWGINGSKKAGPFTMDAIISLKCKVPMTDSNPDGIITSKATINVQ